MNTKKTQYLRGIEEDDSPHKIKSLSGGSEAVNGGCNLYIGASQADCSITVKNIYGDEVSFYNIIQGSIIPFSVTEIINVDNMSKLVALW